MSSADPCGCDWSRAVQQREALSSPKELAEFVVSLRERLLGDAREWDRAGFPLEADIRRTVAKWLGSAG